MIPTKVCGPHGSCARTLFCPHFFLCFPICTDPATLGQHSTIKCLLCQALLKALGKQRWMKKSCTPFFHVLPGSSYLPFLDLSFSTVKWDDNLKNSFPSELLWGLINQGLETPWHKARDPYLWVLMMWMYMMWDKTRRSMSNPFMGVNFLK